MLFKQFSKSYLTFKIPEWTDKHFTTVNRCTQKLSEVSKHAGTTSDAFKKALDKFEYLADKLSTENFNNEIKKSIDVRAVTHLLLTSKNFRKNVYISHDLLSSLVRPLGRITNLNLLSLIRLWFDQFDHLGPSELLNNFGLFLSQHISERTKKPSCSIEMQNLHAFSKIIFKKDGPVQLIQSLPNNSTLNDIFSKPGLQGYESGRFQDICRMFYYIETLTKIPVGTYHSVLDEVIKQEVYNAPFDQNLLIGHRVLSILIDRSPMEDVSDSWQNVILTIAGDPRVPKASSRYLKWWSFLTQEQIAKVKCWLSKFDLKLFLEALEEYGNYSGNTDLQRMFPSRKQFLEGLIKLGLVKHSRLFVGANADTFLRKTYHDKELTSYARVKDTYRSMIYLHVGNCHIIEGSHSFKLWIFSKIPEDLKILDYSKEMFSVYDLSSNILSSCEHKFGSNFSYTDTVHSPFNFNWQHKAITFLRDHGEILDLEEIFSKHEYKRYIMTHGI